MNRKELNKIVDTIKESSSPWEKAMLSVDGTIKWVIELSDDEVAMALMDSIKDVYGLEINKVISLSDDELIDLGNKIYTTSGKHFQLFILLANIDTRRKRV